MRSSQFLCAILGACVFLASVPAAATRAGPPPASAPAPGDEDSDAKRLFNARQYPEAAVAFEQLFAASPAPKHLFNAAMARELAGHEGHAYLLLRRYLALSDLQPAEIDRAKDRLAALQRRTAAVRLVTLPDDLAARDLQISIERTPSGAISDAGRAPLVLAGDLLPLLVAADVPGAFDLFLEQGPWVITARADGHGAARQELAVSGGQAQVSLTLPALAPAAAPVDLRLAPVDAATRGVDLTLTRDGDPPTHERLGAAARTWQLVPGTYKLSARAPGYLPLDRTFAVADRPLTLDLVLTPEAAAPPGKPARRLPPDAWVVGLGAAASATAILGVVFLGVGASQWSKSRDRYDRYAGHDPTNWYVSSNNLFKAWTTYGAGAGLLGGGIGLGLGAVGMHFAPRLQHPKRLWAAGAGIGGALAIAGGLLVGRANLGAQNVQWSHANEFDDLDSAASADYAGKTHHIGLSAALLGFGLGLGLSSILGLARKSPSPRKTALLPTGTGLLLTGRF